MNTIKKIVEKRFEAYEKVNQLIYYFSSSVSDNDGRFYHIIFMNESIPAHNECIKLFTELAKCNIWLSYEMRNKVLEFNRFLSKNNIVFDNVESGKRYYREIGDYAQQIIDILNNDFPRLKDKNFDKKNKKLQ